MFVGDEEAQLRFVCLFFCSFLFSLSSFRVVHVGRLRLQDRLKRVLLDGLPM
jgi:hypothetical protein